MRARVVAALAALGVALTPGSSVAAEPGSPAIIGGDASGPCEWPSVVALTTGGVCTATLVHPRVIVYAAHCGTLHTHALFGEHIDAPARTVPLLRCERYSDLFAVSSMDYAYCELAEPVEDVAITPILFGCDEALIEVGTPVTIVGFGDSSVGEPELIGRKHAADTQIVGYLSTIGIGGMGVGAESGDSGGPALVQVADGSWRVLGIVSGGGGDGATVQYVPAPKTVAWIEQRSGIDITPCHASDGSWAPTPACEGMFVSADPGASWTAGCPGPSAPPSQDCGPPWTEIEDSQAPMVSLIEPADGSQLASAPIEIEVIGEAQDSGVGVAQLRLLIDGEPWLDALGREAIDEVPPYRFERVRLQSDGPYTLTLEAVDHFGHRSSASAMIMVGEPSSDSGETSEESGESSDDAAAADEHTSTGCGCSSANPTGLAALALLLGVLARRRTVAS